MKEYIFELEKIIYEKVLVVADNAEEAVQKAKIGNYQELLLKDTQLKQIVMVIKEENK
jgi:hypothetical protein